MTYALQFIHDCRAVKIVFDKTIDIQEDPFRSYNAFNIAQHDVPAYVRDLVAITGVAGVFRDTREPVIFKEREASWEEMLGRILLIFQMHVAPREELIEEDDAVDVLTDGKKVSCDYHLPRRKKVAFSPIIGGVARKQTP